MIPSKLQEPTFKDLRPCLSLDKNVSIKYFHSNSKMANKACYRISYWMTIVFIYIFNLDVMFCFTFAIYKLRD